jgi:hypothetical protein
MSPSPLDLMADKQSTGRLLERKAGGKVDSAVPEEQRTSLPKLQALDQLATERILAAGGSNLDITRKILSGTQAPR